MNGSRGVAIAVLLGALLGFVAAANAAWSGKLDLSPTVSPVVIRELRDGQWLAGLAKADLWKLKRNDVEVFHAGLFQAWNAEKANPSFGLVGGFNVDGGVMRALGLLSDKVELPGLFKPAQYLASVVSIDFFGGYRPFHTADVIGEWVYGIGARLRIEFGVKELQKGL